MVCESLISDAYFYSVFNMEHVVLWCVVIIAQMLDLSVRLSSFSAISHYMSETFICPL